MSAILDDVIAYLDSSLATLTAATNLFATVMPESPDDVVAVTETPGPAPVDTMGTGAPSVETPRLQVLSRAEHPATAKARAREAWLALGAIGEGLLGGGDRRVLRVQVDQSPFVVGRDGNDRIIYGFNCQAWRDV